MERSLAAACLAALLLQPQTQPPPIEPRRIGLNADWRFQKGDPAGAERADFDDREWRRLNLPHDWAIEGPFDRQYGPELGALPVHGVAWYRRRFTLPAGTSRRHYSVEFDGAMSNGRVWLNGRELGGRPYGYIGFSFDLTPHLRGDDQPNVLAVRLAPEEQSSRWYPGAGIYRNVWLDVTGSLHVARWGTYLTTPAVTPERATVRVPTTAGAELILRHRRPGRLSQGSVLPLSEPLDADTDGARPSALELGGT